MKKLFLVIILQLISTTIFAVKLPDVIISFRVSSQFLDLMINNNLNEHIIREVQQCYDSASGRDINVRFKIGKIQKLDAFEESGITKDFDHKPHLKNNKPAVTLSGKNTNEFVVILSDQVFTTHVPIIWSKEVEDFFSSDGFQKLLDLENQFNNLDICGINFCDENKYNILKKKYDQIKQPAYVKSNRIYMSATHFFQSLNGVKSEWLSGRILAHEIGHAWGDLDDRYTLGASDNLMTDFKCILDNEQINKIIKYRNH